MEIIYKTRKLEKAFEKQAQAVRKWGEKNARKLLQRHAELLASEIWKFSAHCLESASTLWKASARLNSPVTENILFVWFSRWLMTLSLENRTEAWT